ncbi:MAG TPA: alpha/beta hydrolase [Sphingobium sp.]|uniref:alpha/beta fold hydrolase n=1 Tax=Sphingobium sp. TaxID=1912891 RepID=UPI002ED01C23
MARIDVNGIGIEYELLGQAGNPAVAITPGGRFSKDAEGIGTFGESLIASGFQVLLWDRPNCGASDLCFDGEGESKIQALALTGLIRKLDLGPTVIAGGSAGARVSLFAALLDPEVVSHLVLWWISGGPVSLMMLGSSYCCEPAVAASMGGMEAVASMPAFAEQLERNPRNREILLSQDPVTFIETMGKWSKGFTPAQGLPFPGITREDYIGLKMPVMIFRGSPTDIFHPAYICEQVHELIPGSTLVDKPWGDDLFARRMMSGGGHFIDWHELTPAITAFVRAQA